jgi:phosphoribosylformylglycinamidine synthase PurS subunit
VRFAAEVEIALKPGIADPESATIERALSNLGYHQVEGVQMGRLVRLVVQGADEQEAEATVRRLCDSLLTNPVMEEYRIEIIGQAH